VELRPNFKDEEETGNKQDNNDEEERWNEQENIDEEKICSKKGNDEGLHWGFHGMEQDGKQEEVQ
jgi:hypothetical protein